MPVRLRSDLSCGGLQSTEPQVLRTSLALGREQCFSHPRPPTRRGMAYRHQHQRSLRRRHRPASLGRDAFLHWSGTRRRACPKDVNVHHRGCERAYFGLHIDPLQGGHLPMNGGVDERDTRRRVRIIAGRGGDAPLFQGPEVFQEPEGTGHPVLGHLLLARPIRPLLQVGQRCGFLGVVGQQLSDGADRRVGDQVTAVIHPEVVLELHWHFCCAGGQTAGRRSPTRSGGISAGSGGVG